MKSLPIAEGGDTVSTLSLSEEEHGRAEKMTADVLDIIIAKVSLADGKLDEETNARLLDRCQEAWDRLDATVAARLPAVSFVIVG